MAVRAGIEDILIITRTQQANSLEDHFDAAPELEFDLEATGNRLARGGPHLANWLTSTFRPPS